MGFHFRKSFKAGPVRINLSKSGVGWSVGAKGFRFGHRAGSGRRKAKSQNTGKSGMGTFFKIVLFGVAAFTVAVVVKLAIELVKIYWPWLAGFTALIIAVIVGIAVYKHKKQIVTSDPNCIDAPIDDQNPAEI